MIQKAPIVVGLTGNPGTGKSTISRILRLLHIPVQDSDQVVNDLFQRADVIKEIELSFPEAVHESRINKEILSNIVFQDQYQLRRLEAILHPRVYQEHLRFIQLNHDQKLIFIEIPLLFETKGEEICDFVLYTTCRPEIAWQRVKSRGWSDTRYNAIQKRLYPHQLKKERANFIIDTSLSKVSTWHQLKDVLQEICNDKGP